MTPAELADGLQFAKGRLILVNGPLEVSGQIIALNGERAMVLWASSDTFASPSQFGGNCRLVVLSYRGCTSESWVNQTQGTPPEFVDRRSSAQRDADEAARVVAVANSPLGGAYRIQTQTNPQTNVAYPACAYYIGPASAILTA